MEDNTEDKTIELWRANSDILILLQIVDEIGWSAIREQSIQRILYISKVLYSFVYLDETSPFENYHFSKSVSGPFSGLINRSLVDLTSREIISEDDEGKIEIINKDMEAEDDERKKDWLRTIVYILGLYGESKIFNFTIRDPLYNEAVESNSQKELDISPENTTIKVLDTFKKAFEETLDDVSSINKKEYLELYFEYIFSKIIERKVEL